MFANIDMDLESGDIGVEDTLFHYFSDEYTYIILQHNEMLSESELSTIHTLIDENNLIYGELNTF